MKRMKKKVVAMVTLAMFVMTLLPMAAFAAEYGSTVSVDKSTTEVTMKDDGTADIKVNVNLAAEDAKAINAADDNLYVWLEKDGVPYTSYASYKDGAAVVDNKTGTLAGTGKITVDADAAVTKSATITVKNAGEYTVKVGYTPDTKVVNLSDVKLIAGSANKAVVKNVNTTASKLTVANTTNETENKGGVLDLGFIPNGVKAKTVTVNVESKYPSDNVATDSVDKVVAISHSYGNQFKVVNSDDEVVDQVTVETGKTVDFKIIPDKTVEEGSYFFTLSCDDLTYTLTVQVGNVDNTPEIIEVVSSDETVVEKSTSAWQNFEPVAVFAVKNAKGDLLDSANYKEPFENKGVNNNISVESAPADVNVDGSVFKLEKAKDNRYMRLVANADIPVGEYTVRVALESGDYADVTVTVAKYGKTVDMIIDNLQDGNKNDVDDTVVLGDTITGDVLYVDENGLTKSASNASVGLEGDAVEAASSVVAPAFTIKVSNDKDLLGSKITIKAYDETVNKYITKELTVVDGKTVYSLDFASDKGEVQKNNVVDIKVVDEDGKLVKVAGTIKAYVAKSSVEDANIKAVQGDAVTAGEGSLKVYSDKECTADIVVAVVDSKNKNVYANTLTYTFGKEDVLADTSVVMTLGSTEMLVNNNIVDMKDAAPFAQDNRTFVPFRALGEALGADVEYDKDAKTVTYTLGQTEIVMTLDSKTYTVDGAEKTMDVAPFAKDNRTYVPVRFVGEALGFTVTGLTNANGQYVAVAFTK